MISPSGLVWHAPGVQTESGMILLSSDFEVVGFARSSLPLHMQLLSIPFYVYALEFLTLIKQWVLTILSP